MKTIRFSLALSTLILFSGAVYAKKDPLYQEGKQSGSYILSSREYGVTAQNRPALPHTMKLLRTFISYDPLSKEFKGAFSGLKHLCRGIKQHILDHSANTSFPIRRSTVEKVAHSLDLILDADNIGETIHSAGQKISILAKDAIFKRPFPLPFPRNIDTQSKLYTKGRSFSTTLCKLLAAFGQSQGLSLTKILLATQLSQQVTTFRNLKLQRSLPSLLTDIANAAGGFKEGLQDFPLAETLKSSPKPFNASIARCIYTLLLTWTEAPDHLTDGTAYKAVDTIGQALTTCGKEIEALYR